jgi:uncharacterized protein
MIKYKNKFLAYKSLFMINRNYYALITGATSGIGYQLAKLFATDGYNLIIVARSENSLANVAEEFRQQFNIDVKTFSTDLFVTKNAFNLYDKITGMGLNVSVLVNNAGQGLYGEFINTDINRELDIVHLNIASLIILTKKFLKEMLEKGEGKILNVASVASKVPGPLQSVYHATKAFVYSFTEAIRNEVKDTGVTITALMPGATETDFFNKANMLNAKNIKDGKLADAEAVARDGYTALMKGEDKVVSGLKNKIQVALSNITPDSMLAEQVHKQQAPATEK